MRALALLLPALAACAPAGAQQPPERDLFLGAGSCAAQACHGGGDASRQEYKVWANRELDRHSRAFASLSGETGLRIGQRLSIDPSKAAECLSCHSAGDVRAAATFDRADGVSCELCHGPAGRWLGAHVSPSFKEMSPRQKEALGLRDLTTPDKRAAACVACHVGGEGKDVTHAMMAAGHPPLAFSLPRFLHDMPPHWKRKDAAGDLAAWAEGARVAGAARLRQVGRLARAGADWPEFGTFDCYACHHEIKGGGADARPGARPGDLPLDLAPLVVLAAGDEGTAKRLAGVLATTYRPGGERRSLADAAASAADKVDRLPSVDAEGFRGRVDGWLARVEAGEIRAGYAAMQQVKFLAFALAPDPDAADFAEAYAALDAALAGPYDERAAASLARRALAAR
ncbi:MAG TPA: multiheme c-type cytochrome [Planctomycetota bacterium]|nr:multiheme c-type cytochrome [Planctomycetota bacterium]